MNNYHVPVMLNEVEKYLISNKQGIYVDCTLGGGGHSGWLLSKYPNIRIIALDCDNEAVSKSENELGFYKERLSIVKENYKNIKRVLTTLKIEKVDGILADLGISSHQVDAPERGFSFNSEVLDMRMDMALLATAETVLGTLDEQELADIFYKYGEERFSRPIARAIVHERKEKKLTPKVLCSIAARIKKWRDKTNPATKIFQALRIYINKELDNLDGLLNAAPDILNANGRIVIMSYHSLEDRLVKYNFRDLAQKNIYSLLTKKVIIASEDEIFSNPRSRSAKLRAAEKRDVLC